MRSAELTLPGFTHDVCSAIHPLGMASPFFSTLPLADFGLEWIQPDIPLAHPLDDGTASALCRSLDETASGLGGDGNRWHRLFQPLVEQWDDLAPAILGPWPSFRHPLSLTEFGLRAPWPAATLARILFRKERARACSAAWPRTACNRSNTL